MTDDRIISRADRDELASRPCLGHSVRRLLKHAEAMDEEVRYWQMVCEHNSAAHASMILEVEKLLRLRAAASAIPPNQPGCAS